MGSAVAFQPDLKEVTAATKPRIPMTTSFLMKPDSSDLIASMIRMSPIHKW